MDVLAAGTNRREYPLGLHPIVVVQDRYGGVYSRGPWVAIAAADELDNGAYRIVRVLEDGNGPDTDAADFWADPPSWTAVGASPDEAIGALIAKYNSARLSKRAEL